MDSDLRNFAAMLERLDRLREDDEIGISTYGTLLIAAGVAEHLKAHPSCDMQTGDYPADYETEWRDVNGHVWDLEAVYEDRRGGAWRWSGGFTADPDTQPTMSRADYSEQDVPLCRVVAAVGPLTATR